MNAKTMNALSATAILSDLQNFSSVFDWDEENWQDACAAENIIQDIAFRQAGLQ